MFNITREIVLFTKGRYKTWTLDSRLHYDGLDYGLDYELDLGIDFGLDRIYVQTNLVFRNFPGLSTIQFLTASIFVSKVTIIQTSVHSFSIYGSV